MTLHFKELQIIYHLATEKRATIFKRRLINDNFRPLGLDAFHHALNGGLAEVVRIRLHRKAVDTDNTLPFLRRVEVTPVVIVVISGLGQHTVGNEVLPRAITFHDCLNQVFGHIGVVCQQLLGVFGQAIAAIAEARVVVVRADSWIEAYAVNDGFRVQALHFGIGVKLVEVADAQGEVGVGEEFHRLRFRQAHEEGVDVLLYRPFL